MQIHELDTYGGNLDTAVYLAVDNGENTGKVSANRLTDEVKNDLAQAQQNLNDRIDNIIAGSPAPSAEEVVDARHGASMLGGANYTSLGAAIRGQISDVQSGINALIKRSINLINTDLNTPNAYINNNTGALVEYSNWQTSDFLLIEGNKTYRLIEWDSASWVSPPNIYWAFYDANKAYTHGGITGTSSGYTMQSQGGDRFLRVSAINSVMTTNLPIVGEDADLASIFGTSDIDLYVAYSNTLLGDSLSIQLEEMRGFLESSIIASDNLLNVDTDIHDYYINQANGELIPYSYWEASDYIPIKPSTVYMFLFWQSADHWARTDSIYYAFYDKNKAYTHGGVTGNGNFDITSIARDAFVRISFSSAKNIYAMFGLKSDMEPLINSSDIDLYQPYGNKLANNENDIKINGIYDAEIILPEELCIAVGREITLYKDNVIRCNNPDNFVLSWYSDLSNTGFDGALRFNPQAGDVGNHTIGLWVYNAKNQDLVASKWIDLKVVADTQRTGKKVIFIGDSLTSAGFYPYEIQRYLSNNGVESLGTRQTTGYLSSDPAVTVPVTVNHEGRGGWNAKDYTTKSTKSGVPNAFWNPLSNKFDFSYYMTEQGYSSVDVVFINLGTNGTTEVNDEITAITEIINSIRNYSAAVPIIVSAIANGNNTQSRYINMALTDIRVAQLKAFDNKLANVYIAPVFLNLNMYTDFVTETVAESSRNPLEVKRQINTVHPSRYGYFKFADVYWSMIQKVL